MVDNRVAEHHAVEQPAMQVRLLEPLHMSFTDLVSRFRQKHIGKQVVVAIVCPPRHEGVNVTRIIRLQLHLNRIGDLCRVYHCQLANTLAP
jgi:hypothetical protein